MKSQGLVILSHICGWSYFTAWTISFYPQLIMNYQRKDSSGLSTEFSIYNVFGFSYYSGYTIIRFIVQILDQLPRAVEIQDIAFSVHAFIIWTAISSQILYYNLPQFTKRFPIVPVASTIGLTLIHLIGVSLRAIAFTEFQYNQRKYWIPNWSFTDWLALIKVVVTIIKYIPQIHLNFRRKNTIGMAIWQFNLDVLGGILSLAQNFISAYNFNDMSYVVGNIPKLLIAIISLFWDSVILLQHYVLYRTNNKNDPITAKHQQPPIAARIEFTDTRSDHLPNSD